MLKNKHLLHIVLIALALTGCAKRGSVSGGPIDTIAPTIVRSYPGNMSTGFTSNEIRIDFDEYVKIKDVNKQLIISPPMEKAPEIVPTSRASRYINIKIKDTLQPNTTYSFNFGQSITDNNEGNPYSQFKFVFSTGTYIDSLKLRGVIKDAYSKKTDNFVNVMLYEANEKYNDSTVYKEKPRYVTNTLDSLTTYSLENLKQGKYYIFAVKDKASNYKYDPQADKMAFLKEPITLPNDTLYSLQMFEEKRPFKAIKPAQVSSNRLIMGYEGDGRGLKAIVKNGQEILPSILSRVPEKDSVQVWLPRGIKADSLQVSISKNEVFIKDFTVKLKEMKAADSLSVTPKQRGSIDFRDKFIINSVTPLTTIDQSKISLRNKDSIAVAFKTAYNDLDQTLEFDFVKEEEQKYSFTLMPGALKDFYGAENDTLDYMVSTKTYADYGNLRVTLENADRFPLLLEILDNSEKVVASFYSEKETQVNFDAILPDKYTLRVIYDDNKNREWDTGNYLQKIQPEEVIYFPTQVDVRSNWDVDQPFDLKAAR